MLNIFVVIDDKDFHGIYRLQGKILKLMLAAIPIYEFGDDNTQLIRCIAVKDNEQITTMNYGVVDTKIRMCQSLMRGQYTMEITDGSV